MSDYSSAQRIIKNLDTLEVDGKTTLDTLTVTGESFLDTLSVTGPATLDTVTSTSVTTLDTARIDSGRVTNLTVLTRAVFSGAPSILMPAAITMPSGTDGYLLTSDGNGRVTLEAGGGAVADFTSLDDSTRIGLVDSTLSTNASGKKIIVGNLNDPETMWDKAAFRALSKGTSWHTEVGHFPEQYLITIGATGDTVIIWDRIDMSRWMMFESFDGGGKSFINSTGDVINEITFLDGILYLCDTPTGGGLGAVLFADFVNDTQRYVTTSGLRDFGYRITDRNHNGTDRRKLLNSSVDIVNSTVNDVGAIRDPFGMPMADGSGRTAHWWVAGTAGGPSVYNPHANAIYEMNESVQGGPFALSDRGELSWYAHAAPFVYRQRTIFDYVSDSGARDSYHGLSTSGSNHLASSGTWQTVEEGVSGGSPAGRNTSTVLLGTSSGGLYQLHNKANDEFGGGKTRINTSGSYPYEKGGATGSYHLESVADGSPEGNDLTSVGTPDPLAGTISMVFGSGYSSNDRATRTHLWDISSAFNGTRSIHAWVKSASAVNSNDDAANSDAGCIACLYDEGGASDNTFTLAFQGDGTFLAEVEIGTGDQVASSGDFYDAKWHHVAAVSTDDDLIIYVDGEWNNSKGSTAIDGSTVTADTLGIGAQNLSGSYANFFNGQIDQVGISDDPLSAEEVRAIYNDGLKAMQTTEFKLAADDVDYAHAKDGYVALGDEDSLQVFVQGATTIFEQFRVASANGNIQDAVVWQEPGTDSASYAYVTTTRLVIVQRDPSLLNDANHHYAWKQPQALSGVGATVVDSSGVEGVFWHMEDAANAAANAGQGLVHVRAGTYPDFDLSNTHDGMTFIGAGRAQSLTQGGATIFNGCIDGTDDKAMTAVTDYLTIRDMSFYTSPGGTCTANTAIDIQGGYFDISNISIIDSDSHGITISTGVNGKFHDNFIWNTDAWGLYVTHQGAQIYNNTFGSNIGTNVIYCDTGGDNVNIRGNHFEPTGNGTILAAGCDNSIYDGNIENSAISNSSTGSTVGDRETY